MPSLPEVSFCLPVFNSTATLERCLRAVLGQQVASQEILVVDNCSTDDTAEKARRLLAGLPHARVVVNERNLGRIENWNRCLELAAGRYLKFALVNDLLLPGSAEMLLNEARRRPDAVMICSQARYVEAMESNPEPAPAHPAARVFPPAEMLRHFCAAGRNDTGSLNGILIKNEVLRRHPFRFRADIPFFADLHHAIELSTLGPVVYVKADSHLFDLGNKGRFTFSGLKVLPYYREVRECSKLMARLLAGHGEEEWKGYGLLFWQYVNHQATFPQAPLPGYGETFKLFRDAGPLARQAFKHRLNMDLQCWLGHTIS